jgi:hypothetical protein
LSFRDILMERFGQHLFTLHYRRGAPPGVAEATPKFRRCA